MSSGRLRHAISPLGVLRIASNALFGRADRRAAVKKGEAVEEGWFRSLVRHVPDVVAVLGPDGALRYASPSLKRVLGYDPEALVDGVHLGLLHPDDVERATEAFAGVLKGPGVSLPVEVRVLHADGSWRYLEAVGNGMLDDPPVVVVVLRDVTGRRRGEEALGELQRSEKSLATAQRIAHVGNWEYSIDKDEAYWSDEMYRIFGLAPREFVPTYKTFLRFVHPDDKALVRKTVREVLYTGKGLSLDYRVLRPDGEVRSVHAQYEVLHDAAGRPSRLDGTVHDITDRKALEERLEHQAFHDSLTGLPNRALFMDRLGQALARAERREKPAAVLFLDLDDFKLVNDSLGHEVGDRLLVEVAGRLLSCVRPADTVARLGGDEFTVLLEEAGGVSEASQVAQRISEALREPFELGEHRLTISASIGIVPGAFREEPGELLRRADLALYGAKHKGKARYEVFEESMTHRFVERLKAEGDLRRAVDRDEFTVYYQPKMLLEGGAIAGVEALVRWEHPARGLISASEFLLLAEETGLIVPIGHKVLEEACRQGRAWREHYPDDAPQTVYINLSAAQFDDPDLVRKITRVVRETGVEPGSLALEISESVLMSDVESTVVRLESLRNLGLRVVMDDFGAAYSSLSQLGRFPMDFLDIDSSFTLKLGAKPEDTAIVSAMINLAHALGLGVTAEGVETADQLARLRALGCDMAQGYYLWEPLSSAEMSAFLSLRSGSLRSRGVGGSRRQATPRASTSE